MKRDGELRGTPGPPPTGIGVRRRPAIFAASTTGPVRCCKWAERSRPPTGWSVPRPKGQRIFVRLSSACACACAPEGVGEMLARIPQLLSPTQVADLRRALDAADAPW